MKEIILKYLNSQYRFTLSTYVSYNLYDKIEKREVRLAEGLKSIITIFGIDEAELMGIFDVWADEQAIIMQNMITDCRYKLYEKTGMELKLTPSDLNNLMSEEIEKREEDGMKFIPYLLME